LQALLENIEKETTISEKKARIVRTATTVAEDEIVVYIHLYNAQGLNFRTWQGMITPKAFFDFSVNRSIYQEQKYIEDFIRSKTNKAQHAYLTVAMKKDRVLPSPEGGSFKDPLGNPLIKVKEGSLLYECMISFTYNGQVYHISEQGELAKKVNEPSTVSENTNR